ncbi:hypothetical protein QUB68_07030 [Microcoleus sp. A006_D1]|uniref:hypothetical protein n=1 Tax=Microcoleus sp. A006_D1 TaxID=3055267 RepID=UPI002FD0DD10
MLIDLAIARVAPKVRSPFRPKVRSPFRKKPDRPQRVDCNSWRSHHDRRNRVFYSFCGLQRVFS